MSDQFKWNYLDIIDTANVVWCPGELCYATDKIILYKVGAAEIRNMNLITLEKEVLGTLDYSEAKHQLTLKNYASNTRFVVERTLEDIRSKIGKAASVISKNETEGLTIIQVSPMEWKALQEELYYYMGWLTVEDTNLTS